MHQKNKQSGRPNTACCAGNPALKMQHWMKNQLVKESYAEQWEDIVRSGAASSVNRAKEPSTASTPKNGGKDVTTSDSAQTSGRLPAEFGTKDKVPAKGMAPMGPADYADGSQWTAHDGTMQRRERDGNGGKIDHSRNGASDHGYIGGDGAKLSGGVRQEESSIATDLASSTNSAAEVDQQHHDSTSGASRDQPQGLAQSPQQARAEPSNRQNGAEPAGGGGSQQSTPSKPTDSSGVKADGGKDKSASSDLDWWREVTAASKRNDRSSAAAAPPPNSQQQNGASRPSHHYSDGRQNGAVPSSQSAGQNGAAAPSPSASSLGHQQASSSDTASKGAQGANASTSQPTRSSSSFSTSASRAPLGTDPSSSSSSADHGLPGQSQSTGRASSSNGPALSPEEAADKNKKTQEVEDVASKIENQIPSKKVGLHSILQPASLSHVRPCCLSIGCFAEQSIAVHQPVCEETVGCIKAFADQKLPPDALHHSIKRLAAHRCHTCHAVCPSLSAAAQS